jgi:hypothetical protein
MTLLEDVSKVCARLAAGWRDVLAMRGLDISAPNLEGEWRKAPKVDRTQPGFDDFPLEGMRAIEPGDPARSAPLAIVVLAYAYRTGFVPVENAASPLDPASSAGVPKAILTGYGAGYAIAAVVRGRSPGPLAIGEYRQWLAAWFQHDRERLR